METYLQGFHVDELFSTSLLQSDIDEVINDEFVGLHSFGTEEPWREENNEIADTTDREDFQQIMSDWQDHLGSLHTTDSEELGLGLDNNLDILNSYSSCDLFGEVESPILSKALKYPVQKHNLQPLAQTFAPTVSKDSFLENLGNCNKSNNSSQKICGLAKTEPNVIRKVTLINGEKEILGKNIIGLHCLNEIKENPDENCQVTSTVINGKRYKIIIKPKSLQVKKLSEEKIRKSLIKKLPQCHLVTKTEPEENHIFSDICNDSLDVPIISSDSWDFAPLDFEWSNQEIKGGDAEIEAKADPEKKITPNRGKPSKIKKPKKKCSIKSDEEIDVETVNDKVVEGNTLGNLLKNFEEKVAKLEKSGVENSDGKKNEQGCNVSRENIKNCLPREMINKIEALKRKKQGRIPLIQAMPTKKPTKNGTRMQDAVATMNRNKLLKIVSVGDSVQLDHDYCSTFSKTNVTKKDFKKSIGLDSNLAEKNPKKDSGMESGDVSDASEGPNTPDCLQNLQSLHPVNKELDEHCRAGDHSSVTKAATAFFRASNAAAVNRSTSSSDSVKTKTVSNGNKVLTNDIKSSNCNSDNSKNVSNEFNIKGTSDDSGHSVSAEIQKNEQSVEQCSPAQSERPKKKLKLEEYLSRRSLKEKEKEKTTDHSDNEGTEGNCDVIKSVQNSDTDKSKLAEKCLDNTQEKPKENQCSSNRDEMKKDNEDKKFWRSRRSSSSSSRERRRRSRSKSRSRWRRSSSKGSDDRRREGRGKQRRRRSGSRERKNRSGFWSGSLSRSPSRESSTSSDRSVEKHCRNSSNRHRRRSRSQSVSRGRSTSRSRGRNRRRPNNSYYNRNFNNRRSKSPFYPYSMREKQRQIEERRVIYVGRIEEGMTSAKLRKRFSIFGPIIDISLHFREYGDNYGFVTYAYKADAYDAVEHGNDDPSLPHYDLCFGGRRGFCKEKYADLDGMPTSYSGFNDTLRKQNSKDSFDLLLKEAQAKLKNRKKQ